MVLVPEFCFGVICTQHEPLKTFRVPRPCLTLHLQSGGPGNGYVVAPLYTLKRIPGSSAS